MCYAKPGPRCSNHATKALDKAAAAYAADKSDKNLEALAQARDDYNLTPKGINTLRKSGLKLIGSGSTADGVAAVQQADAFEDERSDLIALVSANRQLQASS